MDDLQGFISRNWSSSQVRRLNRICQFTKFEVLSLDGNHIGGFQNSEILEPTLYGFGGHHLRIRDILYGIRATFDRSQPGSYAVKHNQTW